MPPKRQRQGEFERGKQGRPRKQLVDNPDHPSPLAIAEILQHIGRFIPLSDLVPCLRVSKEWHRALLAEVWSTCTVKCVRKDVPSISKIVPSFSEIAQKSSYIRKLVLDVTSGYHFDIVAVQNLQFPNLTRIELKCHYRNDRKPFESEEAAVDLITRHQPTLKGISYPEDASETVLRAIKGCHSLVELNLTHSTWTSLESWADQYDSLWSKMTSLGLGVPRDPFRTHQTAEQTTVILEQLSRRPQKTEIKDLLLTASEHNQALTDAYLTLIAKSPNLTRLTWNVGDNNRLDKTPAATLAQGFKEHVQDGFCQRLEYLKFESELTDLEHFETIFTSLPPTLTHLDLQNSYFEYGYWSILKAFPPFMTNIRILELNNSETVGGETVQDIMCSMSGLEVFSADYVADYEILGGHRHVKGPAEGQDWVCTGLKELRLGFVIDKRDREPAILARLAQLTKLEVLDVRCQNLYEHRRQIWTDWENPSKCSLRLNLRYGLGDLSTLTRLRVLVADYAMWKGPEARWIVQNLPSLRRVEGHMDGPVEKIFQSRIKIVNRY
ncbi:hypothetical protein BGZ83_005214 [Gryganskiella cystojenkinii]|nr:hypothetical protein BGZ83_005214 [Gryganskiella cystojenkinii]